MHFRLFSLYSDIFTSFLQTSLIARGISKKIISVEIVNWREKFGLGKYKQVDDRPFGGGSGMVLMPEPILQSLDEFDAVSGLFQPPLYTEIHKKIQPNNFKFYNQKSQDPNLKKATILLSPRGYTLNQNICHWLAGNFEELNILCGRFEGFDARVSEAVDMEISIGNFVTNGGEMPAMCLIEAVSRLIPEFITKDTSVLHDSFSSQLNHYSEQAEFVIGARKIKANLSKNLDQNQLSKSFENNLFDEKWWLQNILPQIEHPQYTRPEIWHNWQTPEVLLNGNHKLIQSWRKNWS